MKVSSISKSLVAPCFMLLASGCTVLETEQKAKDAAAEYLSGTELLQAENNRLAYPLWSGLEYNMQISYWDSIATACKAKEAYILGGQMVKDSLAGKSYTRPEYKMPVDTVIKENGSTLVKSSEAECAKYYTAKEMVNLREQMPKSFSSHTMFATEAGTPNAVHFWNLLTRTGVERKAFNDGAEAERAKLNK